MRNKASLLLMEQLIMLLAFALAAAVCLQGFAYASQVSHTIRQREDAAFLAQSAAEELKTGRSSADSYYYNRQLEPVDGAQDWCYHVQMEALPQKIPGLGQAEVRVEDAQSQLLASLTVGWQEG